MAQTARLEYQLKQVQDGALHAGVFHNNLLEYVKNIVQSIFSLESKIQKQERISLGTCPKCKKGNLFEGKNHFLVPNIKTDATLLFGKQSQEKPSLKNKYKNYLPKEKRAILKVSNQKKGSPLKQC